jgi:hypothetical protein
VSRSIGRPCALRRAPSPLALFALASLLPLACGGPGAGKASVSGKVTYNGQPVIRGTVSFKPVNPEGKIATGAIQPDGSYSLQTEEPGDGALPGDYKVGISAPAEEEVLQYIPAKPITPKSLIPEKYGNPDSSGLTAKVEAGKSNDIPFELK